MSTLDLDPNLWRVEEKIECIEAGQQAAHASGRVVCYQLQAHPDVFQWNRITSGLEKMHKDPAHKMLQRPPQKPGGMSLWTQEPSH
jgi:hypothetical protein